MPCILSPAALLQSRHVLRRLGNERTFCSFSYSSSSERGKGRAKMMTVAGVNKFPAEQTPFFVE